MIEAQRGVSEKIEWNDPKSKTEYDRKFSNSRLGLGLNQEVKNQRKPKEGEPEIEVPFRSGINHEACEHIDRSKGDDNNKGRFNKYFHNVWISSSSNRKTEGNFVSF